MKKVENINFNSKTLRVLRNTYQLSTTELGKRMGFSPSYITEIEKERKPITERFYTRFIKRSGLNKKHIKQTAKYVKKLEIIDKK